MKISDIIYYIFIFGVFVYNIYVSINQRKKDNIVYRVVYLTKPWDWLLAICIIIPLITVVILLKPYVPSFLNWNWLNLLGSGPGSAVVNAGNANVAVLKVVASESYTWVAIPIYLFFLYFLPKAAYWEEYVFRRHNMRFLGIVLKNIQFGLLHCVMGVPIYIGLLLSILGIVFSIRYLAAYHRNFDHDESTLSCTSLHAKYNIILVTLLFIAVMLVGI